MAVNWKIAQEKEKQYWSDIYLSNKKDDVYTPSFDEGWLGFVEEVLQRNNLDVEHLNNKVILDLGSGPAGVAKGLHLLLKSKKLKNSKIIAADPLMDFYKKEIKLMKEDENLKLLNISAEKLNLPDESVDIIFCTNVIDHCENPEKTIEQCERVLKKNGCFYPSLHLTYSLYKPFLNYIKYFDTNHPHHFDMNKIEKLLKKYFKSFENLKNFTIKNDQKDFNIFLVFKGKDKIRALKRVISNYILYTSYFQCIKD